MNKKGFTAYLESKEYTVKTIKYSIKFVENFFARLKKEETQITKPDVLKYLEYLKTHTKQQNSSRNHQLSALNHYFTFLYKEGKITENPCLLIKIRGIKRKTLYKIFTPEELDELCDNYYELFVRNFDDSHHRSNPQRQRAALCRERNAVILSILTNQGVVTGEMNKMELDDVDLIKAKIKIRGGRHSNERTIPLKASQIGLIMNYLQNIRPQILEYQTKETNKLFLPLPNGNQKQTNSDVLSNIFIKLTKQTKTINKKFFNFKQVRASVITNWLKIYGLRKTQYLAGHRYVSSTEDYLPNNLDNLIDDINKLNPF